MTTSEIVICYECEGRGTRTEIHRDERKITACPRCLGSGRMIVYRTVETEPYVPTEVTKCWI